MDKHHIESLRDRIRRLIEMQVIWKSNERSYSAWKEDFAEVAKTAEEYSSWVDEEASAKISGYLQALNLNMMEIEKIDKRWESACRYPVASDRVIDRIVQDRREVEKLVRNTMVEFITFLISILNSCLERRQTSDSRSHAKRSQLELSSDAESDDTKVYNKYQIGKEHDILVSAERIRCSYCGISNDRDAKYCKNCGARF